MKKLSTIILFLFLPIVLASCFGDTQKPNNETLLPNQSQDLQPQADSSTDNSAIPDSSSQSWKININLIQDVVNKWKSLKCTYKDEDNSLTNLYIKDDNIFIESASENNDWSVNWVIKWEMMYMWNWKAWVKINLTTSPDDTVKIWNKSIKSEKDILDVINSQKENCQQEELADSKFEIPSDVEFKELPQPEEDAMSWNEN